MRGLAIRTLSLALERAGVTEEEEIEDDMARDMEPKKSENDLPSDA